MDPADHLDGEDIFYIRHSQSRAFFTGRLVKKRNFLRESSFSLILTPIKFSHRVSSFVSQVGPRGSSGIRQCVSP